MSSLGQFARQPRLSVKLAWLGAGLMALVVGATLLVLTIQVRVSTKIRVTDELRRNQRTFVNLQQQKLDQLEFGASIISRTASLPYALDTYRAEAQSGVRRGDLARTVQRELDKLVVESNKDILFVTDDSGRVFASAARNRAPVAAGSDLSAMPAIKSGLDVSERVARGSLAVLRQPGADFQVAVYPIELGGYTLGTLVLGERLDSGFVAAARATFTGNVIVSVGDSIASGGFAGFDAEAGRAMLASRGEGDNPVTIAIGGNEFIVAPLRLGQTQAGASVQLWLLQPLTEAVSALTRPLVRNFLLYGLLAVILAGLGAALLARSVLRPFDQFVRYLQEGTAAERLETRFDASAAPAEVRSLNDSFGALMEALHSSEAQLRQAQKLEAVGTLAGGVAHDFNNLLTVITGFTQMAMADLKGEANIREDLAQVISASERATVLTRQLLAFSRKQVLQPTVLDPAEVTDDLAPMLRRLIGEHISLRVSNEAPSPYRVLVDRGQLEQVIINLVVNARDAMPRGGRIELRTERVGNDIRLFVQDNGSGIPDDVRDRIFEPFFTTKEPGKGTGLGLSTVYGIVKQSGGSIDVASAPGVGTTFTISLPASDEPLSGFSTAEHLAVPGGTETILLVEDEPSVRALAQRALEARGYSVITADGHREAIDVSAKNRIDLVLTDVVMLDVGGPQLATRILEHQPAARVVYMSGYTDDALKPYELSPDVNFLRKPFTPIELARIVRAALAAVLLFVLPHTAHAQGGVLLQGIADAEFWSTDSGSSLLTRNAGRPCTLGRLTLWGAYEPWRGFIIYAQGEAAYGSAQNNEGYANADFDQIGVRYAPSPAFVIDAGKMPSPVGTFSSRRFSTRNPLIGEPDGYPIEYPVGAQVSGTIRKFDYRVAAVSLPVSHPGYVPDPTAALRPAIGAGFTPMIGLRIGGSATWGPYLNSSLTSAQLGGQSWQHFDQRVVALDLAYSRNYLEFHAEWARGSYDVPNADPVTGATWYTEAKYAIGPRLFLAARYEDNNYPFIQPAGPTTWIAALTDFHDSEFGAGYRLTASTLAKISYRMDHWNITPAQRAFLGPGGHAFAVQLSQSFDALALFDRAR